MRCVTRLQFHMHRLLSWPDDSSGYDCILPLASKNRCSFLCSAHTEIITEAPTRDEHYGLSLTKADKLRKIRHSTWGKWRRKSIYSIVVVVFMVIWSVFLKLSTSIFCSWPRYILLVQKQSNVSSTGTSLKSWRCGNLLTLESNVVKMIRLWLV